MHEPIKKAIFGGFKPSEVEAYLDRLGEKHREEIEELHTRLQTAEASRAEYVAKSERLEEENKALRAKVLFLQREQEALKRKLARAEVPLTQKAEQAIRRFLQPHD